MWRIGISCFKGGKTLDQHHLVELTCKVDERLQVPNTMQGKAALQTSEHRPVLLSTDQLGTGTIGRLRLSLPLFPGHLEGCLLVGVRSLRLCSAGSTIRLCGRSIR